MLFRTSITLVAILFKCISAATFVREESLPKALDELLGLFNCSLGTQQRIQKCLYQMYDDINDYNTWHTENRVHCCIVSKFQDCALEDSDDSCRSDSFYMSPSKILMATSCMDYDQDDFRCHLFFHKEAYFFGFLAILFAFSIICVCAASKPKSSRASVTMIRTSSSVDDLPPSYDRVQLSFPEKMERY